MGNLEHKDTRSVEISTRIYSYFSFYLIRLIVRGFNILNQQVRSLQIHPRCQKQRKASGNFSSGIDAILSWLHTEKIKWLKISPNYVTSFGIPFLHWLERESQSKRLAVIYNRSMTPLSEGVPRTQTGPACTLAPYICGPHHTKFCLYFLFISGN